MIAFNKYRQQLLRLAKNYAKGNRAEKKEVIAALDGAPNRALNDLIVSRKRKAAGAYFTGTELSGKLLGPWLKTADWSKIKVFDPTCGAGDLFLPIASKLKVEGTLQATIDSWGKHLFGCDIHKEFIQTAKIRLVLLALQRGARFSKFPDMEKSFPGIVCQDFFNYTNINKMTHIVMNPPYTLTKQRVGSSWSNGLVNAAGSFVEKVFKNAKPGTKVAALLPEVLRTGTRYERWRNLVEKHGTVEKIKISGHFGAADVDVFSLYLTCGVSQKHKSATWSCSSSGLRIGDLFDVKVGTVVPHRDPKTGVNALFLDVGAVPPWEVLSTFTKRRKYSGRLFNSPFVVIRRTSSPSDIHRAKASVINSKELVAVENHLIVISPKDKRITTCNELMKDLKHPRVSNWFNKKIRCRHLTVGAVKCLPFVRKK